MLPDSLSHVPLWASRLGWSVITVLAASLIGQLVTRTACRRLAAWAAKTASKWEDAVIDVLRRGIPIWSLLVGLYLAIGIWQLPGPLLAAATKTLYVLLWLSVTFVGADLIGKLIVLYGGQFQRAIPAASITRNIAKTLIVILGLLMILHSLGIPVAPLLAALGVGGLAVALALQDTLSNLFSGFSLTMAGQIRVGDYVRLESGQEGYVEDIGWRATKIRMLPNNMVLVPNNKLGGSILVNYDLPSRELIVTVEFGVDYGADLERVERVAVEVAREVMRTVPGSTPDFEPVLRYHTFGEYSIGCTVVLRAREFVDQFLLKHEFIKRLHARYRREGIAIPFPTQTVYSKSAP